MSRTWLKKSVLLCAESDDGRFKRNFYIDRIIDEGASAVCYEAHHRTSGRGVLKEFYPNSVFGLKRDKKGQLIHDLESADDHKRFLKEEKEYLEPYEMLLQIRQSSDDRELATFIPLFEIYHGCDDEGNVVGTTYIWTPEPKLEPFDKICEKIHKHPEESPEYKLFTVLTAIESLTKCICILHGAELLHRDIKPSNFGFENRGNELLTQAISLFDINSVCSVYEKTDERIGTDGFMEMKERNNGANNQTDIYSIGATLFYAIVDTDESKAGGYLYRKEYYNRLHEMVSESRLIQASEANSHPKLKKILTTILQKCLCERSHRYEKCEELLVDLKNALYYLLPFEIAKNVKNDEKWVLKDINSSLDVNTAKNSFLSIQYHLYKYPLYQCCLKEENTIHVLVIGFGNYGQKFLDACLQNGQMIDKKVRVVVVSDDVADKEIYLSERPEMTRFFNIDGSLAEDEEAYGDVFFEVSSLKQSNQTANAAVLQNIMQKHVAGKHPHYVFVALGEDTLNNSVANVCKSLCDTDCLITYVHENHSVQDRKEDGVFPLYINEDVRNSSLHSEIERMAFNTHLVWEKNLNINFKKVEKDFRKKYYHDSCVSSVLALKYKLHSVGIDLNTTGFADAAHRFQTILSDATKREIKNQLIWIEHRRWVTEKICLGWRGIRNLEDCTDGTTKDERQKRHVCIVRSRPDQRLSDEFMVNNEKWDTASEKELQLLDDLDRMSVELHRVYRRRAKAIHAKTILSGNIIMGIRSVIEGHTESVIAFQEWFACLTGISNGEREKVYLYEGLKEAFLNALKELSKEKRESVQQQVKAFDMLFYPVRASMEYRIWKQDDVALVDQIPFVLTFTKDAYMVIPYATGNNDILFGNVAAPTIVNPVRILYLYLIEEASDLKELPGTISQITEYMKKKCLRASVDFIIICSNGIEDRMTWNLKNEIKTIGEGRIYQVKTIEADTVDGALTELKTYLKRRSIGREIFAIEKNNTKLSRILQKTEMFNVFSSYWFAQDFLRFEELSNCDMFDYVMKPSYHSPQSPYYITVTDLMAFQHQRPKTKSQPEFFQDYEVLWEKYLTDRVLWNEFCEKLRDYSQKNDVISSFEKKEKSSSEVQRIHYILPTVCGRSAAKVLNVLKDQGMIEKGSYVNGRTTDSCDVTIMDRYDYYSEFDRLFSRLDAFVNADDLSFTTSGKELQVLYDDLKVSDLQFTAETKTKFFDLLEFFKKMDYIINPVITSEGIVRFAFASKQIKELMTNAKTIMQIYLYHKIKNTGRFHDVAMDYSVNIDDGKEERESYFILTKGFRTLFVMFANTEDVTQNTYEKLVELADEFGVNATGVLVANGKEKDYNNIVNHIPKKDNITTIWKQEEIQMIDQILVDLMGGT